MSRAQPSAPHSTCRHEVYGLTCEAFDALRARAGDQCEVCGRPADGVQSKALYIDHDHEVGMGGVRGLVCTRCNVILGLIDAGRVAPSDDARFYLANAWHLNNEPDESFFDRRAKQREARSALAAARMEARRRDAAEAERIAAERAAATAPVLQKIRTLCRRADRSAEAAKQARAVRDDLIREAVRTGTMTAAEIYTTYDISKSQIERVLRGNTSGAHDKAHATASDDA